VSPSLQLVALWDVDELMAACGVRLTDAEVMGRPVTAVLDGGWACCDRLATVVTDAAAHLTSGAVATAPRTLLRRSRENGCGLGFWSGESRGPA